MNMYCPFFFDYIEIERNVAHKYNMEENIFRMEKRACNYEKTIELIEIDP